MINVRCPHCNRVQGWNSSLPANVKCEHCGKEYKTRYASTSSVQTGNIAILNCPACGSGVKIEVDGRSISYDDFRTLLIQAFDAGRTSPCVDFRVDIIETLIFGYHERQIAEELRKEEEKKKEKEKEKVKVKKEFVKKKVAAIKSTTGSSYIYETIFERF